jgi:PPOX class probable F420-dependent enzyme
LPRPEDLSASLHHPQPSGKQDERMAFKMSTEEWQSFVSDGTRTAVVSTVRADGRPHSAPVWFVLDGDEVVFSTGKESVKGRNLARDEHVSLCVDDGRPPFSFVILEGRASLSEDLAELRTWATRIAGRYMGEDRAEEVGAHNAAPGGVLVRMQVDKVVSLADIAV